MAFRSDMHDAPSASGCSRPAAADPRCGVARLRSAARTDVAVVGAGVIGLSIAWRLAARGPVRRRVRARRRSGAGTSLAATGMLAAAAEHEPGGDDLLCRSPWSSSAAVARLPRRRSKPSPASRSTTAPRARWSWRSAATRSSACASATNMQRRAGLDARWLSGQRGPAARARPAPLGRRRHPLPAATTRSIRDWSDARARRSAAVGAADACSRNCPVTVARHRRRARQRDSGTAAGPLPARDRHRSPPASGARRASCRRRGSTSAGAAAQGPGAGAAYARRADRHACARGLDRADPSSRRRATAG